MHSRPLHLPFVENPHAPRNVLIVTIAACQSENRFSADTGVGITASVLQQCPGRRIEPICFRDLACDKRPDTPFSGVCAS
jgi:hypothetical protein